MDSRLCLRKLWPGLIQLFDPLDRILQSFVLVVVSHRRWIIEKGVASFAEPITQLDIFIAIGSKRFAESAILLQERCFYAGVAEVSVPEVEGRTGLEVAEVELWAI